MVEILNGVLFIFTDLFAESVIWGKKSVALAVNGRVCTSSNGVHLPMGVVIVHHVEVTMPTSAYVKRLSLILNSFGVHSQNIYIYILYVYIYMDPPYNLDKSSLQNYQIIRDKL